MALKYSYEYVKNFFKQMGCTLLSKGYENSRQKLDYICVCGHKASIEFRLFKSGKRCKNCQYTRAMETNRNNHGGLLCVQTKKFKEKRKSTYIQKYGVDSPLKSRSIREKRKKTNLQRYGVDEVSKNKEIRNRQIKGLIESYGVAYTHQSPLIRAKFEKTILEKYGVPSLAYLANPASKESQELFDKLRKSLSKEHLPHLYYATFKNEFVICYKKLYFKFDFVCTSLKKAIEYNGYNFHPKPHQMEDEVGWCAFHPTLTVKEARKKEAIKYQGLENRGYRILTVWDRDYHKNPRKVIAQCLNFLLS